MAPRWWPIRRFRPGQQFAAALKAAGVNLSTKRVRAGTAPPGAQTLASVRFADDRDADRADQHAI